MSGWGHDELERIDRADELSISSLRKNGTLRPFVPIWMATVDGVLYVRSATGPNGWYRNALASGRGRIRAGGVERDVTFTEGSTAPHDKIDAEYTRRYRKYGQRLVDNVTGDWMRDLTVRIDPTD